MKQVRPHDPAGKREAILISASQLFVQRGYEHTSIADIAKEAGVAVGSVYRQFPDKVAILSALHFEMEHHLIDVMTTAWSSDLHYLDRFEPMFGALMEALTRRHALLPLLSVTKELVGQERYQPGKAMIAAIRKMYEMGVEVGELRSYPMDTLPSVLHGMVNGGLSAWADDPSPGRAQEVARTLTDLARALATPSPV
jgi:AcrR family transcriptional regulator